MPDNDIKKINSGGWGLVLVGLPFLGIGLLFVFLFTFPPDGSTTTGSPAAGAIAGGIFALVGAGLVFGRAGTILDRRRRTVTTWWGLLVPFRRTEHSLAQVTHVSISREMRSSKNGSYEVFPVRIAGGSLNLTLGTARNYDESRRLAEDTAKFFGLGTRDRSASEEVVREAGTLDESVQARARRLHIATPLPSQPPRAVCTIRYGGPHSTTVIEIPPTGIGAGQFAALFGTLLFGGFVCYQFIGPDWQRGFDNDDWIFAAFFGLFFLVLPIGATLIPMLKAATTRHQLSISATGVDVRAFGFFSKHTSFPAAEIEEVATTGVKSDNPDALTEQLLRDSEDLTPAQQEQLRRIAPKVIGVAKTFGQYSTNDGTVIIRSDRATMELGAALVRSEKEWLRNVIVHVLTADVTGDPGGSVSPKQKAVPAPIRAEVELPASNSAPDYSTQPGKVQRKSGPGGMAISLIGLAALVFVLYQNGVLKDLVPKGSDEPATASETPQTAKPPTAAARSAAPVSSPASSAESDRMLQQAVATAEQAYGPDHPAVAMALYQAGVNYQANKRPKEQEQAWLRALAILQRVPKKSAAEAGADLDKEMLARELGDFYWDQYRYPESYFHYDLAYKLADEVEISDAERNRRLASNSAGIMATACYLGKWEIADYAMEELKERMQTVSPEEQKRLSYWVRTGEPRLKKRKC